jgi:hypothetical protein
MNHPCNLWNIKFPGYLERTRGIGFCGSGFQGVLDFVGAASSRDRFNSRLEAAPTGVFFSNLNLPDKRIKFYLLSSNLC